MIGAFEKQAELEHLSREENLFPFMHDFMVTDVKGEQCLFFFD